MNHNVPKPWKLPIYFNEIKTLASNLSVEFRRVLSSANGPADVLAKLGVLRSSPWEVSIT